MFKDLQYLNRFPISKKRKVINSVGQRMCDGLYEEIGGQADVRTGCQRRGHAHHFVHHCRVGQE